LPFNQLTQITPKKKLFIKISLPNDVTEIVY